MRQVEINLFYCFESNIYTIVISAVISTDGMQQQGLDDLLMNKKGKNTEDVAHPEAQNRLFIWNLN